MDSDGDDDVEVLAQSLFACTTKSQMNCLSKIGETLRVREAFFGMCFNTAHLLNESMHKNGC